MSLSMRPVRLIWGVSDREHTVHEEINEAIWSVEDHEHEGNVSHVHLNHLTLCCAMQMEQRERVRREEE